MCYFETCQNVISEIDTDELARKQPVYTYPPGSGFMFRSLGRISMPDGIDFLGVKTAHHDKAECEARLPLELALTRHLISHDADFKKLLPSFMGLLKITETGEAVGILTEDIGNAGQKALKSIPASQLVRQKLHDAFKSTGRYESVLNEVVCDDNLAFDVEGSEKLLDFTPPPIKQARLNISPGYRAAYSESLYLIPEITISIPSTSNLARALLDTQAGAEDLTA